MRHCITKHQDFPPSPSLICGGLADLKICPFAVCFSGRKMSHLFCLVENVWDFAVIWIVFLHTAAKRRWSGSPAHSGTRLSAVSLRLLSQSGTAGGSCPTLPPQKNLFCRQNSHLRRGPLTSTEDAWVVISQWMDVSISASPPSPPNTKVPLKPLCPSSDMLMENRDLTQDCMQIKKYIISINILVYIIWGI